MARVLELRNLNQRLNNSTAAMKGQNAKRAVVAQVQRNAAEIDRLLNQIVQMDADHFAILRNINDMMRAATPPKDMLPGRK